MAQKSSRAMVEDWISAEIVSSGTERQPNPSALGSIASSPSALMSGDTTYCVPEFFPIGSVAFPESLLELWRSMRYSSQVGLFPSVARLWLAVDNKLVLWDYRDGRELTICDEIPELIVTVGTPLVPKEGVFQPHVTFLLPVATSHAVYLLGICAANVSELLEFKVLSLGYSAVSPALVTKMTCAADSGRIFCAGADGNVYEVRYLRESTPLVPKIQLVCFSYLFSSRPVLGQITSVINSVREAWTGPRRGLRDIVVDERRGLLIALDEASTISVWHLVHDGLKHAKSLAHQSGRMGLRYTDERDQGGSTLVRLFIVDPDQDGSTLLAIALNGDQYRYRYSHPLSSGSSYVDLAFRSTTPACSLATSPEVSACFASGTTVVLACGTEDDEKARDSGRADELVVSTLPKSIMAPHAKFREIVAFLSSTGGSINPIVRVDAIEAVPSCTQQSPNDLCAQVCDAPPLFMVLHRHGLAFYSQSRPVDTLYTLLSASNVQCRESLLRRFAATFSVTDYAAMLLQVAIGGLTVYRCRSSLGVPSRILAPTGASAPPEGFGASRDASGVLSLEYLGRSMMTGGSVEARRTARELLRAVSTPTAQVGGPVFSASAAATDTRQVVVAMSPFACAVMAYLGRALYSVWDVPVVRANKEDFIVVREALSLLSRFLESIDVPSYSEDALRVDVPHQWVEGSKVVVTLSSSITQNSLSLTDLTKLQRRMLSNCYELARRAIQTCYLVTQSFFFETMQEERRVTVAQVLRDQEMARRLGQSFSHTLLASQHGLGSAANERLRSFAALQKNCPYFFSSVSLQEFQVRSDIEALTRGGQLGKFRSAELAQWAVAVAPKAAAYWNSGALQSICQELNELKREDISVQLLLHAAKQLDPENAAVSSYRADRTGGVNASRSGALDASAFLTNGSSSAVAYQTKMRVLGLVISVLETAWQSHRSVVDELLGGPRTWGTIWAIEPTDEVAHCVLFDWLRAPRSDPSLTRSLRETLAAVRSPFLESYLQRNRETLGEEYARFLRRAKGNYEGAIEQCVVLSEAPLNHIPVADRLGYRVRCLREAMECSRECRSDQALQVEQRLRLLEVQQRLLSIIGDFLGSGNPSLDERWRSAGTSISRRELAHQHIDLLSSYVLTSANMVEVAGMYVAFGGAEVQLDVLIISNSSDANAFAAFIMKAYSMERSSPEDVTRRLVTQYYKASSSFPLTVVIRMQEAATFRKQPTGTASTVRLLAEDCNVDPKVLFYAYQDIVEQREPVSVACEAFQQAGVTRGYLAHAMALLCVCLCRAVCRGTLQHPVAVYAMGVVRNCMISATELGGVDADERRALDAADALLQQGSVLVNSGNFGFY